MCKVKWKPTIFLMYLLIESHKITTLSHLKKMAVKCFCIDTSIVYGEGREKFKINLKKVIKLKTI